MVLNIEYFIKNVISMFEIMVIKVVFQNNFNWKNMKLSEEKYKVHVIILNSCRFTDKPLKNV